MSTLWHAVFKVTFNNVYFGIVSVIICGLKSRFSASSQNSITEKSIFGQFEAIFLNL